MDSRTNALPPELHSSELRAWHAFGIWLRVATIAVGLMVIGAGLALEGASTLLPIVACLTAGTALAALAWRRLDAALRHIDRVDNAPEGTAANSSPRAAHPAAGTASYSTFGLAPSAVALD